VTTSQELGVVLLASGRPTLVEIWCWRELHNVANVYSHPGGPLICVRGWKARSEDWHEGRPVGGRVWAPTNAYPLDGPEEIPARCRCGSLLIARGDVRRCVREAQTTGTGTRMRAPRSFSPD
jgi:hypothetical protein